MRKSTLNVRGKNLLWIGLTLIVSIAIVSAAILTMTMVVMPASASYPAQAIWVDPGSYLTAPELDTLKKGDTFTVDVWINITDPDPLNSPPDGLFGFDYKLRWDATNIKLTSRTPYVPAEWGNYFVPADRVDPYNATHRRHWYGVSALVDPTTTNFTGAMSICTYNFEVIETVYEPNPDEIAKLDLYETKLADDAGNPITHTAYDGQYRKCAQPIPPPELLVKPEKVHGVYGEKFNVTIEIIALAPAEALNMCRWNATLSYNTTMLDAEASWEGPFLPGFEGPNGTSYTYAINDTLGTVYMTGSLGLPATPPNGTGVLAIIEFNATWQYTVSSTMIPPISSSLSLYNNNTVNCANLTIPSTVGDPATYNAPYKPQVLDHPIEWPPASGEIYHVTTVSNSSVSPVPMNFNQSGKYVSFNVTGTAGYYGFCNVTIPNNFLTCADPTWWEVRVDGAPIVGYAATKNATHTTLSFTYVFLSTREVEVEGTWVVPEFPIAMILPLLFIATLAAAVLGKKVRSGKRRDLYVAE